MRKATVLVLAFVLFACNTEKKNVEPEEQVAKIDFEKELAAIEVVRADFSLALKEGRYEEMGKWVTPDVKQITPGSEKWLDMFALGQERGMFPYDSISMKPQETLIMNDSMAYDWGSSHVYYTNKEGEPVELRNSFLAILKKVNGEWKLHREVASSIVP